MNVKAKLPKWEQFFIIFTSSIITIGLFLYSIFFFYHKFYGIGMAVLLVSVLLLFLTKKNYYYLTKTGRLTGKITRKGKKIE